LAESEGFVGEHEAARKRLERLAAERPGNRLVTQAQAEQLSSGGNRAGAHKAADLLRPLVADRYEDVSLQLAFARANELAGDEVRAGEAHAEVALLNGRISDALYQLQSLIKRPDVDYYQRARIEARIAEVTPYALEQRKKLAPEQRLGFGFSRGDRPGRPAAAAATAHD
jgi:predicted Zn-dependent protease